MLPELKINDRLIIEKFVDVKGSAFPINPFKGINREGVDIFRWVSLSDFEISLSDFEIAQRNFEIAQRNSAKNVDAFPINPFEGVNREGGSLDVNKFFNN